MYSVPDAILSKKHPLIHLVVTTIFEAGAVSPSYLVTQV